MSNIRLRLIFFFVAFPLLFVLVFLFPFSNYLVFNLIVVLASGAAAVEVANIFRNRGIVLSSGTAFLLAASGPMATYLELAGVVPFAILPGVYTIACAVLLVREIFHKQEEEFRNVLPRLSAYFFILVYPGYFSTYAVRVTSFPHAGIVLLVFLSGTYLNDSAAWATGVLWGKNSRNILTVSPNKSLVGFIFGFLATVLIITGSAFLLPVFFPLSLPEALVMGTVLGISTIFGDLVESALKRSGVIKDSGRIVPGRGGFLDSVDSPLFNAPIFFYLYWLFTSGPG